MALRAKLVTGVTCGIVLFATVVSRPVVRKDCLVPAALNGCFTKLRVGRLIPKLRSFKSSWGVPPGLKDLAPLIRAHDPEIMAPLKSTLTPLANRLCLLLFLLDLEAVLVGGGSSALGNDLIKPLAAMVRERMWEKYSETVAFKVCELHNDAGITGAVE